MDELRYAIESERDAVGQENLLPQDDMNQASIDAFDRLVPSLRKAVKESSKLDKTQKNYLDNAFASMNSLSVNGVMEKTQKYFETPFTTLEDTAIPMFDAKLYAELVNIFEGMPFDNKEDDKQETIDFMRKLGGLCLYWEQSLALPRAAEEHIDSITVANMEFEAIDIYEKSMEQIVRAYIGIGVDLDKFKDIPGAPQNQADYNLDLDQAQRETFENYVVPVLKANPGWLDDPTTADALVMVYGEVKAEDLVNEYFDGASVRARYVGQPVHEALRNRMIAFVHTAKYRNQFDKESAEIFNVAPNDALFFNLSQPLLNAFADGVTGQDPVFFARFERAASFVETKPLTKQKAGPSNRDSLFRKTRKRERDDGQSQTDDQNPRDPKNQKGLNQSVSIGEKIEVEGSAEQTALLLRTATDRFSAISDRILELFGVEIPKGWTTSASLQEAWSKATLLSQLEEVFETGEIPIGFKWFNPVTAVGNVAINVASVTGRTILGAGQKLVSVCGRLVKGSPEWLRDAIVNFSKKTEFITKSTTVQAIAAILAVLTETGVIEAVAGTTAATIAKTAFFGVQALNLAASLKQVYTANDDNQRNAAIAASLIQFVPMTGNRIFSAFALPGAGIVREINMLSAFAFSGLATVKMTEDIAQLKDNSFASIVWNILKNATNLAAIAYNFLGAKGLTAAVLFGGLSTSAQAGEVLTPITYTGPQTYSNQSPLGRATKALGRKAKKALVNGLITVSDYSTNVLNEEAAGNLDVILESIGTLTETDVETVPEAFKALAVFSGPSVIELSRYHQRQAIHATMRSAYEVGKERLDTKRVLASTGFGLAAGIAMLGTDSILVGSAAAVAESIGLAGALGTIGTGAGAVATTVFGAPAIAALVQWSPVLVPAMFFGASAIAAYYAKINEEKSDDTDDTDDDEDSDSDTDDDDGEDDEDSDSDTDDDDDNGGEGSSTPQASPIPFNEFAVVANVEDQTREAIIRRMLRRTRASTPHTQTLRRTRRRLRHSQSEPVELRSYGNIMQRVAAREVELENSPEFETTSVASIAEAFATQHAAQEMLLGLPGPVQVRSAQIDEPESMKLEGQEAKKISLQEYARRVFQNNPDLFTKDFKRRQKAVDRFVEPFNRISLQMSNLSTNKTGIVPEPISGDDDKPTSGDDDKPTSEEVVIKSYVEMAYLIQAFVEELANSQ
ncbi:MAG: hypothetical protein CMP20_01635 [Rickettsiales bacterium]|nr:hypothetical protein [Rickettsiales bacterium]